MIYLVGNIFFVYLHPMKDLHGNKKGGTVAGDLISWDITTI